MTMRSLFKRKGKKNSPTTSSKVLDCDDGPSSPPPAVTPIDPDGSTASHSSNENNYRSSPSRSRQRSSESRDDAMAAVPEQQQPATRVQGKNCDVRSGEGVPIITSAGADHFSPSAVSAKSNFATNGFYSKSKQSFKGRERPRVRPSAKSSAFGGAPRYDWMDIETTAALKIQATYRRLQTQKRLDDEGLSTPGMRNRRAQRRARYQSRMSRNVTNADVPFPFNLCGVGLLFGDGTLEDEKIVDSLEKKRVQKKKKQLEKEDEKRRSVKSSMRKKESQRLEEGIEVVESIDES